MLQTSSTTSPMQLLAMTQGLIIHQALYSAAKLGVADLLKDGPQTCSDLARTLKVNESALYRVLRLLASQSVFVEKVPSDLCKHRNLSISLHRRAWFGPLHSHFQRERVLLQPFCRNSVQHRDWSFGESQGAWGGWFRVPEDAP